VPYFSRVRLSWRERRWTPLQADAVLALSLFVVQSLLTATMPQWGGAGPATMPDTGVPVVLWTALTLAPVVIRRRWPWPALILTLVTLVASALYVPLWTGQGMTLWVMAYTVAAYERWWPAVAVTAALWIANDIALVTAFEAGALNSADGAPLFTMSAGMIVNVVAMVVTFLIGRTVRARRETAAALAERAAAAEASQQTLTEQAVAEERRRIARELHDVVAHHVSVIGVMATGARRMMHRDPVAADEALTTIEQTSRTTLRELRRLLFVLRASADGPADSDAQLSPQPDVRAVRLLVEQVTEAGLPTALRIDGTPDAELDPGVSLTAYRIVQEALTNTLKHAGPARAEVRLRFESCLLTIEVFDTGRGPRASTAMPGGPAGATPYGHGLVGMRERVAVYGGGLRTGPRPGGGFRVLATIPLTERDAEPGTPDEQQQHPEPTARPRVPQRSEAPAA
jgi:signal transduction histidine kinase